MGNLFFWADTYVRKYKSKGAKKMLEIVDENEIIDSKIGKHIDTKCFICESTTTKVHNGHPAWYKYKTDKNGKYDKTGIWNKKNYICSACYAGDGERHPTLKRSDFKTRLEYANTQAQRLGFKDEAERAKINRWKRGVQRPIEEAKDSGPYFGICIGEKYISKTFDNPKMMPYGNPGYDWICKNGLKIQLECRCLCDNTCSPGANPQFKFTHIDYNKVADVFILSGWKDRESLEPLFVLAFKKDDIVRGEPFWMRNSLSITNSPGGLAEFKDFEVTNKLDKLKEMCKDIKIYI